ncbi:MAG: Carboxypeptidase regulatory-like domain [Thermoplasmata archaeon]|nr:Carboxypeptidase regulatory-like domain [Thermoplasmata archaeon]
MRWVSLAAIALLSAALLAGCASKAGDQPIDTGSAGAGAPELKVDQQTGGIRGVVVDSAITPVAGAKVAMANGAQNTVSDKSGLFTFSGLKPGDYFFTVSKPGYTTVQATATVKAGDAAPPVVKVQIDRMPGKQPYMEVYKLNGFYECAFSFGLPGVTPIITDQCDFGVRTAYDEANGTAPYPAPRNVMSGTNTQYFDVTPDTATIIQEAFWTDDKVPDLMVTLSSTPIDNSCDCSDTDYLLVYQKSPTFARLDADKDNATMPLGKHVASRGFLNWNSFSTATNFQFTVITTLFHNYKAADGWTFETQDQYPIG